jgi:hypothetical protein
MAITHPKLEAVQNVHRISRRPRGYGRGSGCRRRHSFVSPNVSSDRLGPSVRWRVLDGERQVLAPARGARTQARKRLDRCPTKRTTARSESPRKMDGAADSAMLGPRGHGRTTRNLALRNGRNPISMCKGMEEAEASPQDDTQYAATT